MSEKHTLLTLSLGDMGIASHVVSDLPPPPPPPHDKSHLEATKISGIVYLP